MSKSSSATIRERLDHPIVDADAHLWEIEALVFDHVREVGGAGVVEQCRAWTDQALNGWYRMTPSERRDRREPRQPWWGLPTRDTRDMATALLPRLFRERLDEFGIDHAVIYPTVGMLYNSHPVAELRQVLCRAFNKYAAAVYREHASRMTPTAVIPVRTPTEAIAELNHAVGELGHKAIVIAGIVGRPVPAFERDQSATPDMVKAAWWLDGLGLDSAYDYDPFWKRCVELKVAVGMHQAGLWGTRTSISNYMHNHIGMFAASCEAFVRSLFFGGVTRRFPTLNIGLLEGGAGWAANMLSDLVSHWQKRNRAALSNYEPAGAHVEGLARLLKEWGERGRTVSVEELLANCMLTTGRTQVPDTLDEWAALGITRVEDVAERFVPRFFFGCEGDDRGVQWAFDSRSTPFGVPLQAMYGSDLGHWDVVDMADVLHEAWEPVEEGRMTPEQFRHFTFTHAVRLHAGMNPDFFRGTVIEDAVAKLLAPTARDAASSGQTR